MALSDLAKLINAANKQRTPEQEFLYMLNEAIQRENPHRKPSQMFKPSSLGNNCLRMHYFMQIGVEPDVTKKDPNLICMGDSGTDRHERLQRTISKMQELGYDLEWIDVKEYLRIHQQPGTTVVKQDGMETLLENSIFKMRFKCDGIIKFMGVYYILEIKTETSMKWMGRTCPADDHITQACAYSTCIGIDRVMYLYECRDNCAKKPFIVVVTPEDKQERVVHKIESVNAYIEKQEVPPKSTEKCDCKYCDYKAECKRW